MGQGHSFQFSFSSLKYPVSSCKALHSSMFVNESIKGQTSSNEAQKRHTQARHRAGCRQTILMHSFDNDVDR